MAEDIARAVQRRRTFAIISHPDAGKTTLTEKLLLFGGAIQLAGTVKGRKAARHATSDWMALEQQRGISVTSSVMQFPYDGRMVNLLDQTKQMRLPVAADSTDLLVPVFRRGRLVYERPTLDQIRHRRMAELRMVADGTKRFDNPDEYRVGLEKSLYVKRESLIIERRGGSDWEDDAARRVRAPRGFVAQRDGGGSE
jgi:hypothetical protein